MPKTETTTFTVSGDLFQTSDPNRFNVVLAGKMLGAIEVIYEDDSDQVRWASFDHFCREFGPRQIERDAAARQVVGDWVRRMA